MTPGERAGILTIVAIIVIIVLGGYHGIKNAAIRQCMDRADRLAEYGEKELAVSTLEGCK